MDGREEGTGTIVVERTATGGGGTAWRGEKERCAFDSTITLCLRISVHLLSFVAEGSQPLVPLVVRLVVELEP